MVIASLDRKYAFQYGRKKVARLCVITALQYSRIFQRESPSLSSPSGKLGERRFIQIIIDSCFWRRAIRREVSTLFGLLFFSRVISEYSWPGAFEREKKKKREREKKREIDHAAQICGIPPVASRARPVSACQMKICHCQSVAVEIRTRWRSHQHAKTLLFV